MKAKNDALECRELKLCQFAGSFPSVIDVSNGNMVRRGLAEIAQPFVFDLTCNVTGDTDVNETWIPSANLPGLSDVRDFQIGTVVGDCTV